MPLALFGITDPTLSTAVKLVILVLVVLAIALSYWVFADARRRIGDPVLVTTATLLGLVPFVGPLIYSIVRPPEFLEDIREREVETLASELRMRHLAAQSCSRCEHPIERSWLRCPQCQHRLKDPCVSCNRPVDPGWSICPYCETRLRRSSSEAPAPRESSRDGARSSRREDAASKDPQRSSRPSAAAKRAKGPTSGGSTKSSKAPSRSSRTDRQSAAADTEGPDAAPTSPRPRRRSPKTPAP